MTFSKQKEKRSQKVSKREFESVTLAIAVAGVAQLVEHLTCNQKVVGSIPTAGSTPSNFSLFSEKTLLGIR